MTDPQQSISRRRRAGPHPASAGSVGEATAPTRAKLRHRAATRASIRAAALGVAAALASGVSACGVTVQDEPEPLDLPATTSDPTPTVTVVPDATTGAPLTSAVPPTTTNEA